MSNEHVPEHDDEKDRELRERWEASIERGNDNSGGEASNEDDNQDQLFSDVERQRLRNMGLM
jgi:hypothetical protein